MDPVNLIEYEETARRVLPQGVFDFIAGAADDEWTLARNRAAWQQLQLLPRVLNDVSALDPATMVLGQRVEFPVLLAPVALLGAVTAEGELAAARAAQAAGTVQVLSTMASRRLEDVAAAADGPKWFQLYVFRDRAVTKDLVQRAEAAGYRALCVTVDVPALGRRERDFRNALQFPPGVVLANFLSEADLSAPGERASALATSATRIDPSLTWKDIDWLRSLTSLPVLLKGILAPEDALIALDHGVAGIVVSNHGGRQLDGVPAALEALPAIVEAVQGRAELLVDGGVRRGTDVLKGLALGARAVLIGRPYVWGLAADGEAGATRVLALLRAEFELAMALCGAAGVREISPALVR